MSPKTWNGDNKVAGDIPGSPPAAIYLLSAEMLCGILASDDGGAK